jgi:hypothetical protein
LRKSLNRNSRLQMTGFDSREKAARTHARLQQASQQAGGHGGGSLRVPPLPPPPMKARQLRLQLCHVVSPQKFWVRSVERREELGRLHRLLAEAGRAAGGLLRPPAVRVGQVFLAPDTKAVGKEVVLYRSE